MTRWHQQFAAQEIPPVALPPPSIILTLNPHALRTFAEGRYHELHPPYDRPWYPAVPGVLRHGHSPLAVAGLCHPPLR